MLSNKDIKVLRFLCSRGRKWLPIFIVFIGVLCFFLGIGHLYLINRVCKNTELSWERVWVLTNNPDFHQKYSGMEMWAASEVRKACNFFSMFIIFLALLYVIKKQNKYNLELLEYIDGRKSALNNKGKTLESAKKRKKRDGKKRDVGSKAT